MALDLIMRRPHSGRGSAKQSKQPLSADFQHLKLNLLLRHIQLLNGLLLCFFNRFASCLNTAHLSMCVPFCTLQRRQFSAIYRCARTVFDAASTPESIGICPGRSLPLPRAWPLSSSHSGCGLDRSDNRLFIFKG